MSKFQPKNVDIQCINFQLLEHWLRMSSCWKCCSHKKIIWVILVIYSYIVIQNLFWGICWSCEWRNCQKKQKERKKVMGAAIFMHRLTRLKLQGLTVWRGLWGWWEWNVKGEKKPFVLCMDRWEYRSLKSTIQWQMYDTSFLLTVEWMGCDRIAIIHLHYEWTFTWGGGGRG